MLRKNWLLTLMVICLIGGMALGIDDWSEDKSDEQPTEEKKQDVEKMSPRQRAIAAYQAIRKLATAIRDKDYKTSEELCERLIELQPENPGHHYNLACCQARLGKKKAALKSLAQAVKLGWDDVDHMRKDPDLESLREEEEFAALAKKASQGIPPKTRKEDGQLIVEGKVSGGFHYRVRMSPEANSENPHRLVVWMHPSGGSMNSHVEGMAKSFLDNDLALVVFTKKNFAGWTGDDAIKAMQTVSKLGQIEGIDPNRPILFGYSAGGQMALALWSRAPEKLSGLILDAAYPLDMAAYQKGKVKIMDLPEDANSLQACPMMVLVGTRDGGAAVWKKAQPQWEDKLPLEMIYVEGKPHTWLFGKEQIAAMEGWLKEVQKAEPERRKALQKMRQQEDSASSSDPECGQDCPKNVEADTDEH
jgi:dienelactone hydrolase